MENSATRDFEIALSRIPWAGVEKKPLAKKVEVDCFRRARVWLGSCRRRRTPNRKLESWFLKNAFGFYFRKFPVSHCAFLAAIIDLGIAFAQSGDVAYVGLSSRCRYLKRILSRRLH